MANTQDFHSCIRTFKPCHRHQILQISEMVSHKAHDLIFSIRVRGLHPILFLKNELSSKLKKTNILRFKSKKMTYYTIYYILFPPAGSLMLPFLCGQSRTKLRSHQIELKEFFYEQDRRYYSLL